LRRLSAILLLALFSFSLIAPALVADADTSLPACCRRAGKHHCAMAGTSGGQSSSGPAFAAGGRCPYFPDSFARVDNPVRFAAAVSPTGFNAPAGRAVVQFVTSSRVFVSLSRSNPKRGPPSYL
jgi:hypothetical protein